MREIHSEIETETHTQHNTIQFVSSGIYGVSTNSNISNNCELVVEMSARQRTNNGWCVEMRISNSRFLFICIFCFFSLLLYVVCNYAGIRIGLHTKCFQAHTRIAHSNGVRDFIAISKRKGCPNKKIFCSWRREEMLHILQNPKWDESILRSVETFAHDKGLVFLLNTHYAFS